jgi:hypothetical protein
MAPSSCTDSAYDLAEVKSDDIVIGSTLSGPLGNLSISTDEFPDINDIIKDALGEVDIPEQSIPWDFELDGIGDNIPMLREKNDTVHASSASFSITSEEMKQIDSVVLNNGTLLITLDIDNFTANDDRSDLTLTITLPEGYRLKETKTNTKTFDPRTFKTIQEGINTFRQDIECIAPGPSDIILCDIKTHFPEGANVTVKDAPVVRASAELKDVDYEVVYGMCIVSDTIKDVFEPDMIDLFFDDEIDLIGSVTNGLSFDFWLTMVIADGDGNPLITYPANPLYSYPNPEAAISADATTPEITFFSIATDEDIAKMKRARHIIFEIKCETVCIKPEQKVTFDLKFKKEGGLAIDNL